MSNIKSVNIEAALMYDLGHPLQYEPSFRNGDGKIIDPVIDGAACQLELVAHEIARLAEALQEKATDPECGESWIDIGNACGRQASALLRHTSTIAKNNLDSLLAFVQGPSVGFNLSWGRSFMLPSPGGGSGTWYWLEISGQEAVGWGWLEHTVETLGKFGIVTVARMTDVEAGGTSSCKQLLPFCNIGHDATRDLLLGAAKMRR